MEDVFRSEGHFLRQIKVLKVKIKTRFCSEPCTRLTESNLDFSKIDLETYKNIIFGCKGWKNDCV